jgi:hypothetical protein
MISPLSPQVNAGEYGGTIQQLSQQLSQQPPQPPTRSLPGIVNRSKSTQPGIPANMAIEWNEALEQLLITWAEKANGHAWLHSRCINHYKQKNKWITIPAAVFGYLAGTTTLLGGDSLNREEWFRGIVGISAIIAGILSNLQQTFTYKELGEQHRIASLRFFAFFRDVSAELSLEYKHRANVLDYITLKRMELDKLYEQSPTIPQIIIDEFNDKFKKARYHKPDVALNLQTIVPYSKIIRQINNGTAMKNYYMNQKNPQLGGGNKQLGDIVPGGEDYGSDKGSLTLSDRIAKEKHRELLKEAFKRWKWFYLRRHHNAVEAAEKEHGTLVEVANSDGGSYKRAMRRGGLGCGFDAAPRPKKPASFSMFWGNKKKEMPTMKIPLRPLLNKKIKSLERNAFNDGGMRPPLAVRSQTERIDKNRNRKYQRDGLGSRENQKENRVIIPTVRSFNSLPELKATKRDNLSTSYYTYASSGDGDGGSGDDAGAGGRGKGIDLTKTILPTTNVQPEGGHQRGHHRHHHKHHHHQLHRTSTRQNTVISNHIDISGGELDIGMAPSDSVINRDLTAPQNHSRRGQN